MRRFAPFLFACLLAILAAVPASAARPERFVIDVSDPAYEADIEALLVAACGYAIEFDATGHIIVIIKSGTSRGVLEVDAYNLHETFSANGRTLVVNVDAGPDLFRLNADGQLVVAITGRSITGSGVIGRVVLNLETFEIEFQAGNDQGDFIARLCSELAPD